MADQSIQNVVNQTQSVGDPSPSDVPATTTDNTAAEGGEEGAKNVKNNQNFILGHAGETEASRISFSNLPTNGFDIQDESKGTNIVRSAEPARRTSSSDWGQDKRTGHGGFDQLNTNNAIGINGRVATPEAVEDGAIQQSLADASGGSDTDASRPGTGMSGQIAPSSSVKKPAFKAVSVTKNFLAKTAGSTPTAKSAVDKASFSSANSSGTPLSQTSRPRLVAKSTSGLRDSAPKSRNGGSRGGAGGPDPMQVWNKNRPVQSTPPKHLTDEELKQQYGIHMTSRIQADADGKEAKWADIDDDEDDWAPETIEWNDGTKITLSQTENVQVATPPPKPIPAPEKEKPLESIKPSTGRSAGSVGPNATILKLGGNKDSQQAKSGTISAKGSTDKLGLPSAKAPAPPPSKSPWAQLPPVDRISPVNINPPMPPQSRSSQRDASGFERPQSIQQPTREMAADDFNRNLRDGHTGIPRELFNSQSGRYEPVGDGRRGSRNDQHFRPSSLLQRPSHNDQAGSAEPSAAFQTSRTSHQDGMWARRRTSSNVSGGSGGFGRRMSLGKPSDLPPNSYESNARRGSFQVGSGDRVGSPRASVYSHPGQSKLPYPPRGASPGQFSHAVNWQAQGSPASQHGQPASPASVNQYRPPGQNEGLASPPAFSAEDPVAAQQRIMREKRDEARKRRQEEEEREEAEKRERIRIKLEAMGPLPSKKGKEKPVEIQSTSLSVQPIEPPALSPPKPPIPEASGEPKQYGMMKVHHPETVRKMNVPSERMAENKFDDTNQSRRISSPSKAEVNKVSPAQVNGIHHSSSSEQGKNAQSELPQPQRNGAIGDKMSQSWASNATSISNHHVTNANHGGADVSSPWGGARLTGHPSAGGNLWGPPTQDRDRALGNGTFDRNLTTFPHRDLSLRNHQTSMGLPITPDAQPSTGGPSPQQPFSSLPPQTSENLQSGSSFPPKENRAFVENSERDMSSLVPTPGPIGPPSLRPTGNRWQVPTASRTATSAWNNFHSVASREESEENRRYHEELAQRLDEEKRTGIRQGPPPPPISETWRQVELNDDVSSRNVVKAIRSNHSVSQSLPQAPGFGPVGSLPGADRPVGNVLNSGRGSRFFPAQSENVQSQGRLATSYSPAHVLTPYSPPPEGREHPVFDGDSRHPIVNLPHPKPVVKLPSATISPPITVALSPPHTSLPSLRPISGPIVNTSSWQDRFNGLLGKKVTPEKKNDLAVLSATKEPYVDMALGAAVSLPRQDDEIHKLLRDAGKVVSKDVEDEEAIFEDREAGSLPIVRLPHIPLQAAWLRAVPLPPRPRYFKYPVGHATTAEMIDFSPFGQDSESKAAIAIIRVPGMQSPITKTLPRRFEQNSRPRQRNTSTYSKPRKGGPKSKEIPSSINNGQTLPKENLSNANGNMPKARSEYRRGGGWSKVPLSGRAH